jgi:hypothetical protein
MAWTFAGVAFLWTQEQINGLPARAEFNREPRLAVRALLDTGDADVARVGYQPWTLEGGIWVSSANAAAFKALNGLSGSLTDGTSTWTAVASITLNTLHRTADGATGTARFIRPRASE